jgi:nitrite reductase (NADH) small subunit
MEYRAGKREEFREGSRLLLKCGDAEIGIFVIDGELYAWHNACAHRGGPVCQGRVLKRVVEPVDGDAMVRTLQYHAEDTHIVCPWHGYEFNIKTGEHPGHAALALRKASVSVRDGEVYVVPG